MSGGGYQDVREERPVGLRGFSFALLGGPAGKPVQDRFERFQETIQRRVLPLLRPAAGQVRAHLRDHPLGYDGRKWTETLAAARRGPPRASRHLLIATNIGSGDPRRRVSPDLVENVRHIGGRPLLGDLPVRYAIGVDLVPPDGFSRCWEAE